MKKLIILLLSVFIFCSCDAQAKKTFKNNAQIKGEGNLELVLKKQIEKGKSGLLNNSFDINTYKYNSIDLEVIIPEVENYLKANGHNFLNNEVFNKKIELIFGRIIDSNSKSKFLFLNFQDRCDRELKYYRNDNSIEINSFGMYIIKNINFITELYAVPELIDYKKDYPQIEKYENSINVKEVSKDGEPLEIYLWKNSDDLKEQRKKNIQTLVARNMYLFNDSKAQGLWLRAHDENFMKNLVTTFGYTKDKVLLQWVIEKNRFKTESRISNGEDYGRILWHKTCDGKLVFHKEVIDVMVKDFDKEHQSYVDDLFGYLIYLEYEKATTALTFKEKAIILANIFDIVLEIEQIEKNGYYLRQVGDYYENNVGTKDLDEEFKSNNYYGLPNFKTRWEEAKKEGDGMTKYGVGE